MRVRAGQGGTSEDMNQKYFQNCRMYEKGKTRGSFSRVLGLPTDRRGAGESQAGQGGTSEEQELRSQVRHHHSQLAHNDSEDDNQTGYFITTCLEADHL